MEFKQISSEQDWSDASVLRNRFIWNSPLTPEEMRSFFEINVRQNRPERRELGITKGRPTAFIGSSQNASSQGGKDFWLRIAVDPAQDGRETLFQAALHRSIHLATGLGAETARFETRSEYPWTQEILVSEGFEKSMRLPVSSLKVQDTNYPPTTLPTGDEIIDIIQYAERHPQTWEHDLWRLEMDIAADLPLPFPFEESPFEDYREELNDPLLSKESQFVYIRGDRLAGTTQLHPCPADRRYAVNGLTGTRREFRRQRVAMHLKQHSACWAKTNGFEQIFTDNEENNPMYDLNVQLGFQHIFDNLIYSRTL